jgi:hypothetical protein
LNELKKATDHEVQLPKPDQAHDCLVDAEHDRLLFKAMTNILKAERRFIIE